MSQILNLYSKYKNPILAFVLAIMIAGLLCPYNEGLLDSVIRFTYQKLTGETTTTVILDNKGIPIVDYGASLGKQRNPVTVSLKASDYWDQYQSGDEEAKKYFLNCADWLVENATVSHGYALWEYQFPWKTYAMTPPWRSGMAQGLDIQVLIRAYDITHDQKYLTLAKLALQSFYVEIEQGGVTIKEGDGQWYEEYADEGGLNPRVLNGMIFALLGIQEYFGRTGDQDAEFLFEKGVSALKKHLPDYDTGYWTYYDSLGSLASKEYHHIHVTQMAQLYDITNDSIFKSYYDKWQRYENPDPLEFWLKFFHNPSKIRAAIFTVNFLALFTISELVLFLSSKRKGAKSL